MTMTICHRHRSSSSVIVMVFIVLIAFISLIGLIVLHEFGHFILAKKLGVKVEEFGLGYPPRIIGKKIGQTFYSLNLLPLGAFVKIPGEIERKEEKDSFSSQPVSKRALIVLGGCLSFWVIAAILFSIALKLGTPSAILDEENHNLVSPRVQIYQITPNSPAQIAGLKPGDSIKQLTIDNQQLTVNKVNEVQEFVKTHKGKGITLTIERGKEIFEVNLVPRTSPPAGEGPMGVALVRTAIKKYPFFQAIKEGILGTFNLTLAIIQGYTQLIINALKGKPSFVQAVGPVGVLQLFTQAAQMGVNYFLQFVGIIAIYLAIFNILPIPALDGGKLLFLTIEAVRKKPVSEETEKKLTAFFFGMLILFAIFVTIKDIRRLF